MMGTSSNASSQKDVFNPGLKPGDRYHGYVVKKVTLLTTIRSILYELEHLGTGAKHLHIGNKDSENTFSVAFKTIPMDATGVAHILEHTVLCGSRKFPVRDPFFSMLKRSLRTFMNALTASDWTMYPFATQNRKDYYNLMDVYLDAVFFPNLDELNFMQEGHRLEILPKTKDLNIADKATFDLSYQGIVYNEMKGAMSSPSQIMVRALLNALYPDTTYGVNSGGDPESIPTLTHDQLIQFHRRYYHPSNAFFYTYGNLPLEEHLTFIAEKALKNFSRIDPQTDVPNQPRWDTPRILSHAYPLDPLENPSRKAQVCVGWLLSDINDTYETLILTLLNQVLLSNAASPLRKALIDSELGSALSDATGFDSDNRDTMFTCGLKDVAMEDASKIEGIIFKVFEHLIQQGIDPDLIEGAVHQLEFHRKEITNSPYPYGIKLFFQLSSPWLHGAEPDRTLLFDEDLARLRHDLLKGPFLEQKLKTYFIDNPHRVLFTLKPDPLLRQEQEKNVKDKLNSIKNNMGAKELERIADISKTLTKHQEATEDLSVLPTLSLSDIPPEIVIVPPTKTVPSIKSYIYSQPTSDIFYFTLAGGVADVPKDLRPLVPFFCSTLSKMGTRQHDYMEMAKRMNAVTGGVGLSAQARTRFDQTGACLPFLTLSGKCLNRNVAPLFDIITEFLHQFDYSNLQRLKSLLFEYRAGLESMIVDQGHKLAMSLATRYFSTACGLSESWHGIHQVKTFKKICKTLESSASQEKTLQELADQLMCIARTVFLKGNLKLAFVGEKDAILRAEDFAAMIQSSLPETKAKGFAPYPACSTTQKIREGWQTQSAVSFVATGFETVRMFHKDAPALSVIAKLLKSMFLHREIREKGGAYGGFSMYNAEDGIFYMASYRDPHICNTLNVFERAADYIRTGDFTKEDVKEAILQVCSEIDKPDTPGQAARKAFLRNLISLSDDTRKRYKKSLIGITRERICQVADTYFADVPKKQSVAVISGAEKLAEANQKLMDNALEIHKIDS